MPVSRNPRKRDFYVYTFKVRSYPFYVGIGRSQRGPDRIRYVCSLLKRHNKTKLQRSSFSVRVMAKLICKRNGPKIKYTQTRKKMNRNEALALEKQKIARLIRQGYLLTNWQHNPYRHLDVGKAVRAILKGG